MVCIYCGGGLSVINSRPQKSSNSIWRRRQCKLCAAITTTVERIDLRASIRVRHSGALEPFLAEKLLISVHESLKHTANASESASALTNTICHKIMQHHAETAVVSPQTIIRIATEVLLRFNKVAGLHYQASHQE